jgi:hypothetical protein
MWVLDYLDDIESDMSAFHRVNDIYELDGPLFFSRAIRLPAYQGVLAARVAEEQERTNHRHGGENVERKSLSEIQSREGAGLFSTTKV